MENFEPVPRQQQPGATPAPATPSVPNAEARTVSASEELLEGSYATNAIILSTKDEFMIDFMTVFPPKPRIVSRVVVTPTHMAKILEVWKTALSKYEAHFGALPELAVSDKPKTKSNAGEFYQHVKLPEDLLGGAFANSMEVNSRKDDFLISFQTVFPPKPRLTARVIMPVTAFKRMIPVAADAIKNFEQKHGPIQSRP